MRMRMVDVWDHVRTKVLCMFGKHYLLSEDHNASSGERAHVTEESSTRTLSADYTELMGGSVPCPSCKGTGRIPKEMEETLVALIPLNDDRLKPKRTCFWVLVGISICILIASGVIFMLVPRAVELHSNKPAINIIHVTEHKMDPPVIRFYFMNYLNISNANYYGVQVMNTSAMIISKFQPWSNEEIGRGLNTSSVSVPPLSTDKKLLAFNNSVTLTDVVAEYCQAPFSRLTSLYVNMQFDIVVSIVYFNHHENVSLSTNQQLSSQALSSLTPGVSGDMETLVKDACEEEEDKDEQMAVNEEAAEFESNENGLQQSTEQEVEGADDEMLSIASSDLAMADETYECSDDENLDGLTEYVADEVERFDIANFKPEPTKNIRPPWFKCNSADCDSKNWEIFMETLEAFDHDTILEGIEDFIVTIETLMPHLASCFTLVGKDGAVTEKEVSSRIMIWLEMCLSRDVQAFEEVDKMYGVAFGIIKTVVDSPNGASIGQNLIEMGMMEHLLLVLEESECAVLRMGALHAIFQLISSPTLWRKSNARLCEMDSENHHHSLYSRLVALTLGERFFISKDFLSFVTLTLAWSRFINALTKLEIVAHQLFSVICDPAGVQYSDIPTAVFSEKWNSFLISLNAVREYIAEFDDEKVCAAFDVYAILESSELLPICTRLLGMSRIVDVWPNVLQLIQYFLNDKYYGTFFVIHSVELKSLYTELKLLADAEKPDQASQLEDCDLFEEGHHVIDEKFPSAGELYHTIAYRLHVLHILDEIRGCAGSMRHNIDDETRVSALLSLCELCNDTVGMGREEVVWMLAQKYVYYLMDIIEHAASRRELRSSAALALSVHLLEAVLTSVDDPKFWIRQAKAFFRLLSKRYITSRTPKLYEYLIPFSDPVLQGIGSCGSDVVMSLFKKMSPSMERLLMVNPTVIAYARILEAAIIHANYASRLEIYHTMEHGRVFDTLAQWLLEFAQHRHALWQMGEPASSEASKKFLTFAFPVLRIFAAYFRVCGSLLGQTIKGLPTRRAGEARNYIRGFPRLSFHIDELGTLNDVLLDAVFLMWSCSGGINGQKFNVECRKIRLAVLDVLTPSLFCEKSLAIIIRHVLLRSCSRPHLFPAALGILLNLAPYSPPLFLTKADLSSWKNVVIGHRQRVNRFVNALFACENRYEIAEVLLAPSPYISEMSNAFVDRLSRLDLRLAQDLVEILLNYIVTSFETRLPIKFNDNTVTPAGSVTGEDASKENEKIRPASTGMVRLMESFVQLCKGVHFRTVLYYFLSRYPSRHRYLLSILSQFERPTFESERQSRYQSAVLDLLSGICSPSLWSNEFTTFENDQCITSESIEECHVKDIDSQEPLASLNAQERKNSADESVEIISDEIETDDAAAGLELVEETDSDSQPSTSLEAAFLSLCRFVNNPDQKLNAVQKAFDIMMKATSDAIQDENAPFLKVISGCLRRTGLHKFFERLNKSFNSGEVMVCLHSITSILDNLFGEHSSLFMEVLDCSPSDSLISSIISQINDKPHIGENDKCVLEILNRFSQSLNSSNEASHEEVEVPLMYGNSSAVAKLYCDPLVTVVAKSSDLYKRIKAATSILVKRRPTNKTRMGSEVAKVIEANRGKEKAFRRLLRAQLGLQNNVPPHKSEKNSTAIEKVDSVKEKKTATEKVDGVKEKKTGIEKADSVEEKKT